MEASSGEREQSRGKMRTTLIYLPFGSSRAVGVNVGEAIWIKDGWPVADEPRGANSMRRPRALGGPY